MSGMTWGGDHGAQYSGGSEGALFGLPLIYPPLSVSASDPTQTSVDLTWQDNNPDEYGFGVEHARYYPDVDEWGPWRDAKAALDPDTESVTDDTVQPGWDYRFRVYAFNIAGEEVSDVVEDTTTDSGARTTNVPTTGWYLEVTHPDTVVPLTPRVLEGARELPTVNDLPRVEIPVPYNEKWHSDAFNQADIRAWKDGDRLPIGEVDHRRIETQGGQKRTVLEAVGGVELRNRVEKEVEFEDAHVVAGDIASEASDLVLNIDDPSTSVTEDSAMAELDSTDDYENAIEAHPFGDDVPLAIQNGIIGPLPSAAVVDGQDYSFGSPNDVFDDFYVNGTAINYEEELGILRWTVNLDYDVPDASWLGRLYYVNQNHPGFEIRVDGTEVLATGEGSDFLNDPSEPRWTGFASTDVDITSGETEIELEITELDTDDQDAVIVVDAMAIYDPRYTIDTVDESISDGGPATWPNIYPDEISVQTQDYPTPFSVAGGRFDADFSNTEENQAIEVSNDQGSTWHPQDGTQNNTTSVDHDWGDTSSQIRGRLTFSYYDDGSTENTTLQGRQTVDVATLFADIDDTPTLANRAFDGRAVDLLQRIAEDRNFVWEIRAIDDETLSLEWAQPGQRSSDADPDVVSFELDRQTEDLVEQMTIFGSNQWRRGETPEDGVPHETPVDLRESYLKELSESVIDPSDGSQYERGEDYEMRYLEGQIVALDTDTGSIPDGGDVELDYQYQIRGTYPPDDEVSNPREDVETIIGLGSSLICEQAAFYIVDRANEPLWEGTMEVARGDIGWSVIDEINPPDIPTQNQPLQIRAIETTDESIQVRLASRRTTGELIESLNQRMSQLSERS